VITDFSSLLSFLFALFLWPPVLLGIDLHLNLDAWRRVIRRPSGRPQGAQRR
jgi:hypothetical protein